MQNPMTPSCEKFSVEPADAGVRFDHFLIPRMEGFSRVRLQALIGSGHAQINGRTVRSSRILRAGDEVEVSVPAAPQPSIYAAQDLPLDILYEDDALLVLNKPPGLVVHPGAGNADGTLVNALLHHCVGLSVVGGVERPGIVHRLDKETSGCMVVAKSDAAHHSLSSQFSGRKVEKTYLAVVEGTPRMPHGTINAPIGRHPVHRQKMAVGERGREALTLYRVLASHDRHALVECRPRTGRTHQIRVHLKHLGHPVAGDPIYGRRNAHPRHLLHAWKITFGHPDDGRLMSFTAPAPPDFPQWAATACGF